MAPRPTADEFFDGFADAFGTLTGYDLDAHIALETQDENADSARALDLRGALDAYALERLMALTAGKIRTDPGKIDYIIEDITGTLTDLEADGSVTLKEPVSEDVVRELLILALGRTTEKLLGDRVALDKT